MNARDWHPVQLGLFWILIVLFGFPLWIGLSIVGDFLAGRYPHQDWFEFIPIGLAFVVVSLVAAFGLLITSRWLDARAARARN
jgi:hypothetical protein